MRFFFQPECDGFADSAEIFTTALNDALARESLPLIGELAVRFDSLNRAGIFVAYSYDDLKKKKGKEAGLDCLLVLQLAEENLL